MTGLQAGRSGFTSRYGRGRDVFQIDSEAHPASYQRGTGGSFAGGKAAEA
jgi:hypothetical protein